MRALLMRALLALILLALSPVSAEAQSARASQALGVALQARSASAANAAAIGPVLYHAQGLHRFRAAMGGVLTKAVVEDYVGDSLMQGVCVTGSCSSVTDDALADRLSMAGQARTLYARRYGFAEGGVIIPQHAATDTRVTSAGTSNTSSTGAEKTCLTGTSTSNAGGAATVTYTTGAAASFGIQSYQGTSSPLTGSFSYNIDGAGAVSVANTGNGYVTTTAAPSNPAATSHTVVVTSTSTNAMYQCGLRYDAGAGVVVFRHGKAGWTAMDHLGRGDSTDSNANPSAVGNATAQARLLASTCAYGVNLCVIGWGHNDWAGQFVAIDGGAVYETPTVYAAALRSIVAAAVANGADVLLVSHALPPTQTVAGEVYPLALYNAAKKAIALDPTVNAHVAYLDLNEAQGSVATGLADSLYGNSNTVHRSIGGYGFDAQFVLRLLDSAAVVGP